MGAFGRLDLIVFCREPESKMCRLDKDEIEIAGPEFEEIGHSTVRVATDVFDQEAYLVWDRGSRAKK